MPPIELQIGMDSWQFFLQPHHVVRVWRVGTMELIAELSAPLLESLISQYLFQAALVTELQHATRKPLASAPIRGGTPALGAPSAAQRLAFRAARRRRRRPA